MKTNFRENRASKRIAVFVAIVLFLSGCAVTRGTTDVKPASVADQEGAITPYINKLFDG